jgi:hypothetical protein
MLEAYGIKRDTEQIEYRIETTISRFNCIVMHRFTPTTLSDRDTKVQVFKDKTLFFS